MSVTYSGLENYACGFALDKTFEAMSKPKPARDNRHFTIEPAHLNEQAGDNPPLAVQQVEPERRNSTGAVIGHVVINNDECTQCACADDCLADRSDFEIDDQDNVICNAFLPIPTREYNPEESD